MNVFGIDIGGSGIKGAPVDTQSGELLEERVRIKTPSRPHPRRSSGRRSRWCVWRGGGRRRLRVPRGCQGRRRADGGEHRQDCDRLRPGQGASREIDAPVSLVNDADAAGLAEVRWGAGRLRAASS